MAEESESRSANTSSSSSSIIPKSSISDNFNNNTNYTKQSQMDDPIDVDVDEIPGNQSFHVPSSEANRRGQKRTRTLKSPVSKGFEILDESVNGFLMCKCKRCDQLFEAGGEANASHLKKHLAKCKATTYRDVGQMFIANSDSSVSTKPSKFKPAIFRELVSMAIVRHGLPYQFVEYEGVRELIKYASLANSEDQVKLKSRNTVKSDINKIYAREKENLKKLLHAIPGKISVTSDLWTSISNDGYITLAAHFIDKEFTLRKKILSFSYMPTPHTGASICEKLYTLLCDWGIEKKLFSMTLNNASSNDICVGLLRSQLNLRDALVSNGEYFHIRCCCHILNLIVHDGLKEVDPAVVKVRESIKYFGGSQARKKTFYESVKAMGLPTSKGLRQDITTRWDSTYYMLDSALFYRNAFANLALDTNTNYRECPTHTEWIQVGKICKFLGKFAQVIELFSGTLYPTSNLFFPQLCEIQLVIQDAVNDGDEFISKMGKNMQAKFNKYWVDYNKILAICAVMDPRYKIQVVEFCYAKLYGPDSPQMVDVRKSLYDLFSLYFETYSVPKTTATQASEQPQAHNTMPENNILQGFDKYVNESSSTNQKTQLDMYLLEPRKKINDNLDVLLFWKSYQFCYPELSRLACDLLSIPISTVASESAFSVGGRVLDQYRSALLPEYVEALICTNNWLFKKKDKLEPTYEELTEDILEEFRKEEQSSPGLNVLEDE